MNKKTIGSSGLQVSPLGFGGWAIGGPFLLDGLPDGWGEVDDKESIRAVQTALDQGINFFDTADVYGTGHSEEIVGQALQGRRQDAVIATKFGFTYDAATRKVFTKLDVSRNYIRWACQASLRRLGTDYIDLYQIHPGDFSLEQLDEAIDGLERLKQEGLIRAYGWSTWSTANAEQFARKSSGAAIQHPLNVLSDDSSMVELCERHGLSSINNSPLAMGLLSGKFTAASSLPGDDVRGSGHEWVQYFKDGKPLPEYLAKLDAVREILTSGGRSLVQGALAWIWGKSECTIPIPGLKNVKQVEEAAKAISFGPLTPSQMSEIEAILR
ncbi:aldo/keto reductase [Paenibacillus barengoltzii]|uniref:Predicted oxidoreductase n=1 Tax=Paenibacillus barengoltzii J12 TaxID=935846 RepID=A0ABY1LZK7_9BACL|nr:aldo/keto reductase [Paenibacillus barengoltzii]SMF41501.1 Predicted oxidoreductase [Paenibacillus barengoltzii J12]